MSESFIGGLVSGTSQVIIGHPLDTIKVNLQNNSFCKSNLNFNNLYKGISYPLITNSFLVSIQFGVFDYLRDKNYSITSSSFCAGIFTGILSTPIDRFKIKKQILSKNVYSQPMKGISLSLFREIPANIVYFNSYYFFKDKYGILTAGGVSGFLSWLLTFPVDVIKTRIQSDNFNNVTQAINKGNLFKGITPCLGRSIIVNSGGFYMYEQVVKYTEN